MSEKDVEHLRRTWEAWNRGEPDFSMADPEIVYEDSLVPDHAGETYRGIDGLLRAWERWQEPWEEFTTEVERIVEAGDLLVSIHKVDLRGKGSGIAITLRYAYVYELRDGKIIHFRSYTSPEEALEVVGLSE